MSAPLFVTGRKHRPVLHSIGRVLIGVLVFNALSPLSVLAQDKPVVSAAAVAILRDGRRRPVMASSCARAIRSGGGPV